MTKKQAAQPDIDFAATYRVKLTRSVPVGRALIHPGPNTQMNGETLAATLASIPDAVESYGPK